MPHANLFGTIGTIADTSELQRSAFNQAFELHNLKWNWSQEEYRKLLKGNGGKQRIEDYASARGERVDAAAIHQTKSERFHFFLDEGNIEPRHGVADTLEQAKAYGLGLALVTTTSAKNVSSMLKGLSKRFSLQVPL